MDYLAIYVVNNSQLYFRVAEAVWDRYFDRAELERKGCKVFMSRNALHAYLLTISPVTFYPVPLEPHKLAGTEMCIFEHQEPDTVVVVGGTLMLGELTVTLAEVSPNDWLSDLERI